MMLANLLGVLVAAQPVIASHFDWPASRDIQSQLAVLPWIEVRGILWPQSQTVHVLDVTTGSKTTYALSHAELQSGGGLALSF